MLRITKTVLAAAAVAAVLIFGSALPAQAATGGDPDTMQCDISCQMGDSMCPDGFIGAAPVCLDSPPIRDPYQDFYPQDIVPYVGSNTSPAYGSVTMNVSDLAYLNQMQNTSAVSMTTVYDLQITLNNTRWIAFLAILVAAVMTMLWYLRRPESLK